jgi:hypothetical protein
MMGQWRTVAENPYSTSLAFATFSLLKTEMRIFKLLSCHITSEAKLFDILQADNLPNNDSQKLKGRCCKYSTI